ncbi:MAG: hypothetical protein Q8O67_32435 [Deltaproteobacteria bacterium]|nr:hypothetical protein [Deltaproteobacteria bacterium]
MKPRGFALVIVVVCSVAMVAIAIALVFTAGSSRLVSVKGSAIDQSETIAVAGMERAVAYAERVADVERDFDLLLDPTESINCRNFSATQSVGNSPQQGSHGSGLPRFTDGTIGTYEGRKYRVVPFNTGAYLVRYDDDADDDEENGLLSPFTSNRPDGTNCEEGPAFGLNNPFRDRNRAVWISVIGIYPGIDPDRAKHRTSLRRFHISTASLPGPAIHVGGNIAINGDLQFCSNVGDIAAGGSIQFGGGNNACGQSAAGGANNGPLTAPTCPAPDALNPLPRCTPPGPALDNIPFTQPLIFDPPGPSTTLLTPDKRFWFRGGDKAHCNFYVVQGALGGLFYWDSTRDPICAEIAADPDLERTLPSPTTVAEIAAGVGANTCWVPVFLVDSTQLHDTLGVGTEVTSSGWRPGPTDNGGVAVAILSPSVVPPVLFSGDAKKPNWETCKMPWKGSGGDVVGCGDFGAAGCTGVTEAAVLSGGALKFNSSVALPAATYRFAPGNVSAAGSFMPTSPSSMPTNDDTPVGFGLGTFLVTAGNFIGDQDVVLGIGQPRAPFASLVVNGNVDFPGGRTTVLGGSLISFGNILFENGSFPSGGPDFHFHGMIVARGNLVVNGGGDLQMDYDEDLFGGGGELKASPTTSRTIR